jgi:hypothetical protein
MAIMILGTRDQERGYYQGGARPGTFLPSKLN